jgi:hypothetical protein
MNRSSRHEKEVGEQASPKKNVRLDAETVKRSALSLERVDDVESSDGLSLGVLGISDRVSDDVWEERRQ